MMGLKRVGTLVLFALASAACATETDDGSDDTTETTSQELAGVTCNKSSAPACAGRPTYSAALNGSPTYCQPTTSSTSPTCTVVDAAVCAFDSGAACRNKSLNQGCGGTQTCYEVFQYGPDYIASRCACGGLTP